MRLDQDLSRGHQAVRCAAGLVLGIAEGARGAAGASGGEAINKRQIIVVDVAAAVLTLTHHRQKLVRGFPSL